MTIDYNNLNSVKSNLSKYSVEITEAFMNMEDNERLPYLTKWFEVHPEFNEYFDLWMNRSSSMKFEKCDDEEESVSVERANYSTTKNRQLSEQDKVCGFIEYVTSLACFWSEAEREYQKQYEYPVLSKYKKIRNNDSEVDIDAPDIVLPKVSMKTAKTFEPYTVTSDDLKKYPELKSINDTIKSIEKIIDNPEAYKNWVNANGQPVTQSGLKSILRGLRAESTYVKERLLRPIEFKKLGNGDNHHVYDHFSDTGYYANGEWKPLMIEYKRKDGNEVIECQNRIDLTDPRYVRAFLKCYANIASEISDSPDHPLKAFLEEFEYGLDNADLEPYEREIALIYIETQNEYIDIVKEVNERFNIDTKEYKVSRLINEQIPERVSQAIKKQIDDYRDSKPKIGKHCKRCHNFRLYSDYGIDNRAIDKMSQICNQCKKDKKK